MGTINKYRIGYLGFTILLSKKPFNINLQGEIQLRRFLLLMVTVLFMGMLVACSGGNDGETSDSTTDEQESDNLAKDYTINFGVTPWTSTVPPTKIASLILEEMGYDVEETDADVTSIFIGLSRDEIDIYMDSWMPIHEVHLEKHGDKVEMLAESYGGARGGLVVPSYMDEFNSIEDLIGQEDMFNHEVVSIEPGGGAAQRVDEAIEAYELDMEQLNSSEGGMLAEVMRVMEQEKPIVFYGWRPHTMFNKLDIKTLEDPREVFPSSSIHLIGSSELKNNAPEAYEFLKNWSIDMDDLEDMIAEIDDGADEVEVAKQWINDNRDKVDEMIGR